MPIYEYECAKCHKTHEIWQKMSDPPATKCPDCKGKLQKLISATAFELKGSGWYKTDYERKATPPPSEGRGDGKDSKDAKDSKDSKDSGKESKEKEPARESDNGHMSKDPSTLAKPSESESSRSDSKGGSKSKPKSSKSKPKKA